MSTYSANSIHSESPRAGTGVRMRRRSANPLMHRCDNRSLMKERASARARAANSTLANWRTTGSPTRFSTCCPIGSNRRLDDSSWTTWSERRQNKIACNRPRFDRRWSRASQVLSRDGVVCSPDAALRDESALSATSARKRNDCCLKNQKNVRPKREPCAHFALLIDDSGNFPRADRRDRPLFREV